MYASTLNSLEVFILLSKLPGDTYAKDKQTDGYRMWWMQKAHTVLRYEKHRKWLSRLPWIGKLLFKEPARSGFDIKPFKPDSDSRAWYFCSRGLKENTQGKKGADSFLTVG